MIEPLGISELHKRFNIETVVYLVLAFIFVAGSIDVLRDDNSARFAPPLFLIGIGCILLTVLAARKTENAPEGLSGDAPDTPAKAPESLRLRLMWRHQFQFIGVYRAEKQMRKARAGAVPDAGDNTSGLKIIEGGSPVGLDPRATVANGLDELGITSATALVKWYLRNRAAPDAEKLVPLLIIFPRSPACLIFRIQSALPKNAISVQHLTGKRFHVIDIDDPATMEFHVLCAQNNIKNIQWDLSFSDDTEDEPIENLGYGGKADYRLGYSFNEGYRATRFHNHSSIEYGYALLSGIFRRQDLYADVLFTRKEILDDPQKGPLAKEIATSIAESYSFFSDASNYTRLREINELLEFYCHDWWHKVKGLRPYDTPAQELVELLAEAWGASRQGKLLGLRSSWEELERAVHHEMRIYKPALLPHLEWLTTGPVASSLQ